MANYVASGVQWYTSYGTMRYRGNVTKNKVAKSKKTSQSESESDASEAEQDTSNPYMNFEPSERTLRVHTNKGRRDDTKQEQFPTKKIKVRQDLGEETFFMDEENKHKIEDDFTGESFFMDDNKLQTPSDQKRDILELHSDNEEDEVQEVERSSLKKISASTSKSPHRLASPIKPSDKLTPTQPMGESEMPPPWFGAFLKNYTESIKETVKQSVENMKENVVESVRDLVKDEIENARLKPEQNKKDDEKEEVKEDK
jgi:hypothetical protein